MPRRLAIAADGGDISIANGVEVTAPAGDDATGTFNSVAASGTVKGPVTPKPSYIIANAGNGFVFQ